VQRLQPSLSPQFVGLFYGDEQRYPNGIYAVKGWRKTSRKGTLSEHLHCPFDRTIITVFSCWSLLRAKKSTALSCL